MTPGQKRHRSLTSLLGILKARRCEQLRILIRYKRHNNAHEALVGELNILCDPPGIPRLKLLGRFSRPAKTE